MEILKEYIMDHKIQHIKLSQAQLHQKINYIKKQWIKYNSKIYKYNLR